MMSECTSKCSSSSMLLASSPNEFTSAIVVCELSPVKPCATSAPPTRVEERLLQYGKMYEGSLRAARERRDAEVLASSEAARSSHSLLLHRNSFTPTPSFHASAELARERRRDRSLSYAMAEEATCTHHPAILPVSRDMAAAERERNRWRGLSVADVLAERQKRAVRHLEERRTQEAAKLPFKPSVSAHARSLQRSQPLLDRLYAPCMGSTGGDKQTSPPSTTGEVLADTTNRSRKAHASSKQGSADTYRRLYKDAVERRIHNEQRVSKENVRSSSGHQPHTDAVSELIVSQRTDTAQERLLRPKATLETSRYTNPEETFAPRITAPGHCSCAPLARRTQIWLQRRSDRLRQVAAERRAEEMLECTFRPHTTVAPPRKLLSALHETRSVSPQSLKNLVESADALLGFQNPRYCETSDDSDYFAPSPADIPVGDIDFDDIIPADVLDVLEEAEYVSRVLRPPNH